MLGTLNLDPLLVVQGFVDSRRGSSAIAVVLALNASGQPTLLDQLAAKTVDAAAALPCESVGGILGVLK